MSGQGLSCRGLRSCAGLRLIKALRYFQRRFEGICPNCGLEGLVQGAEHMPCSSMEALTRMLKDFLLR
jgi:hypothetical protein